MKDPISIGPIGTWTLILALMLLMIIVLGSKPGLAEYYRYVDQNGATRYTDDLLEVPEAQRSGVKKIIGVQASSGGEVSADASVEEDKKKRIG